MTPSVNEVLAADKDAAATETTDGKGLFDEALQEGERKKRTKKWTEVSGEAERSRREERERRRPLALHSEHLRTDCA